MKSDFDKKFEVTIEVAYIGSLVIDAENKKDAFTKLLVYLESFEKASRPVKVKQISCFEVL